MTNVCEINFCPSESICTQVLLLVVFAQAQFCLKSREEGVGFLSLTVFKSNHLPFLAHIYYSIKYVLCIHLPFRRGLLQHLSNLSVIQFHSIV